MYIMKAVFSVAMIVILSAQSTWAGTVDWASWSEKSANVVSGSLMVGSTSVDVTYSGSYVFAQINNAGTNYWLPNVPYVSPSVSNAPGSPDIIALSNSGTATITFSTPVINPLIALVSWNGANVTFGGGADTQTYNIRYLSSGCGYWGCGSFASTTPNSFSGSGELHGVIELIGTYQTITFTDSYGENWHGLTVGVAGGIAPIAPPPQQTQAPDAAPVTINIINIEQPAPKEHHHHAEDPCRDEEPGVRQRECRAMQEMERDIKKSKE